jgi:lysophosphatidylcholine acyltransferase/lyso-PAF acetyltransferase
VGPAPAEQTAGADAAAGAAKATAATAAATAAHGSVTHAVREAILEHKQRFRPGDTPIGILPEGSTHNGRGLLTFFSGAFQGGSPVQPVTLRYPFRYHNTAAFLTTLTGHVLGLLLAPWVAMEVCFLPTHVPSEEERADPERMAEAVRGRMAAALGMPLHAIGAKELRKEAQAAVAARRGAG